MPPAAILPASRFIPFFNSGIISFALLSTALVTSSSFAAEILAEDFDRTGEGQMTTNPSFMAWTGHTEGEYGKVLVTKELSPGGSGKSLVFRDTAAESDKGPIVNVSWEESAPKSGHVIMSWKWMVPIEGPYLSLQFAGQSWDDAAAVLILENGKIQVQFEKMDNRETIGDYRAKQWRSVKLDFDIGKRIFDVYLDDRKVSADLAWQGNRRAIDRLSIAADFAAVSRDGNPVLAIDDIKVESK
jgi:hypothetical protein